LTDSLEREVKLGAPPGFVLPDLAGAAGGVVVEPGARKELDATYYDTADLRLIRAGITVRHRTTGGDAGKWTVKFPDEGDHGTATMARREFDVAGAAAPMPAEVAGLVRGYTRAAPVEVVARLVTSRQSTALRDAAGVDLGEVADDEVAVHEGDVVTARFREVEVEIAETVPADLLDAIVDRLRAAGAGAPDPTPKLARALGPRALLPADVVRFAPAGDASAADVVHAGIAAAVARVVEHDHVVRRDEDIEGVHQMRVGLRRLRSDLRTFRPVLDESWSEPLRDELKWLAAELGAVRDGDVMLERFHRQVAALDPRDRDGAAPIVAALEAQRAEAVAALLATLDTERYTALLDRIVAAAQAPRVNADAAAPAAAVVPTLAAGPFKKLRRAVRAMPDPPPDDALHEVRIRAKRARYAADVAVPVIGDDARALAKAISRVQDVLGDHHDAIVAEQWVRAHAGAAPFAAGLLIAAQQHEADRTRAAWKKQWKAAAQKSLRSWIP
jgi:CHAD domain-containing protein